MTAVSMNPPTAISLAGYGSVHFGKSLLWAGEDALALYLMVGLLGVPPGLAGTLFLASALCNAGTDGLFGYALSRWPAPSRHLPAIVLPALLAAGLGFAALPLLAADGIVPVAALLLLFRLGYSLVDVPHNALTQPLAEQHGHLAIARLRALLSGAAALVVGAVAFLLLAAGDTAATQAPALIAALGVAATSLMLPLPWLLRRGSGGRLAPQAAADRPPAPRATMALWHFCAATAIGLAGLAALGKAILHVDFQVPAVGAAALFLLTAGRLGAIWIWSPLACRFGHREALGLAYLASGLAALLIPWLASTDFGSGTVILLLLTGLAGGGVALLNWAVLSEIIAAGDGGRNPAAAFGYFTMSMKVALGLSAAITGLWLTATSHTAQKDPAALGPLVLLVLAATAAAAALIWMLAPRSSSRAAAARPG